MADFQNLDVYTLVTLVDRTGIGGASAEFIYDGIRFPFYGPGKQPVPTKTVPKFVAEYLFSGGRHHVWTKTGTYVNRYAIQDCAPELVELWGPEVADCSPIEMDLDVLEGSDAPLYRTGPVRVERLRAEPTRDRQGRSAAMATGR